MSSPVFNAWYLQQHDPMAQGFSPHRKPSQHFTKLTNTHVTSVLLSLFPLPIVHTIPPKHPPQDPLQTLLLPDAHLKMDRSANAILQDSPDIGPKDSASNPHPRSRAIKNVGTATTDDGPWSKKLRLLDTTSNLSPPTGFGQGG